MDRLTELRCSADDLAEQVRDLRDGFDFEPGELDELESRLDVIYRLKKKYGDSVEDMLDYLERCRKELDEIQFSSDTIARLERDLSKAMEEVRRRGEALSRRAVKRPRRWRSVFKPNWPNWTCRKCGSRWSSGPKQGSTPWTKPDWTRCSSLCPPM